jgi:hypothetical protein
MKASTCSKNVRGSGRIVSESLEALRNADYVAEGIGPSKVQQSFLGLLRREHT